MDTIIVDIFNGIVKTVVLFLDSPQGKILKGLMIVYAVIMLVDIVMLFIKSPTLWDYLWLGGKSEKRLEKEAERRAKMPQTSWERIKAKLNSVNPNDWKIAVIEADKELDTALREAGTPGETMGERLQNIVSADVGGNLEEVWLAHKVRNDLVHNAQFELDSLTARKSVQALEEAALALKK